MKAIFLSRRSDTTGHLARWRLGLFQGCWAANGLARAVTSRSQWFNQIRIVGRRHFCKIPPIAEGRQE